MAGLNAAMPASIIPRPLIGRHALNAPEYPANQEWGISHRIHKAGRGRKFPCGNPATVIQGHLMSVDFISSKPIMKHVLD
jgi:hypothetical protein